MADKPTRRPAAKKAAPAKKPAAKKAPAKTTARKEVEQMATVTPMRRNRGAQGRNAPKYSPTNPAQIELAERRANVYNLRRAGLTFQQISDATGIPLTTCKDDVMAMRDSVVITPVREQLYDDLERVNALFTAVWPAAMRGDTKSVKEARALLDQRAKYMGLYSPIRQVLVEVDGGAVDLATLQDPGKVYADVLTRLDELLPQEPALGDGQ